MSALRRAGAEPVVVPAMEIAPPEDDAALVEAVRNLSSYDAVILGSVAAAQALARTSPDAPFDGPVFCVGAATRRRVDADPSLSSLLRGPRVVPADARAEGLEEAIRLNLSPLAGKRFLFPRPPEGRLHLVERLRASRATVDAPDAYRVIPGAPLDDEARASLREVTAYLFFSGEAVRCFLEVAGEAWAKAALAQAWVGVIGPAGAQRARELGVRVDGVPDSPGTDALLELWRHAAAQR